MPPAGQVKLLRLLETRRYRPVGSTEWHEADFRLICATNKDLARMIADGLFREDLYYRLSVFEIELPPLRERRGDIPLLVNAMLRRLNCANTTFAPSALHCLQRYAFPGNVRELRNIVERAVLLADGDRVEANHLPDRCRDGIDDRPADGAETPTLAKAEQDFLREAVSRHTGTRRDLARKLGVSERVLYRKLASLRG